MSYPPEAFALLNVVALVTTFALGIILIYDQAFAGVIFLLLSLNFGYGAKVFIKKSMYEK